MALAEPAVNGVIGVACGGDDLRDGESIGYVFKLGFEPSSEPIWQRGRKSGFSKVLFSTIAHVFCCRKFTVGRDIAFRMLLRVLYVFEQVFFEDGIFSCSLAGVLAFDKSIVQHPCTFAFTDMQYASHLFAREDFR